MDENNTFEKFPGGELEKRQEVPPEQDFEKVFEAGVPEFADRNEAGVPELSSAMGGAELGGGEFAGDKYGVANPENEYYGEVASDEAGVDGDDGGVGLVGGDDKNKADEEAEMGQEYNAGIADAAGLINYGLNAAARDLGVETVVQTIKGFDVSGRADPIGDLFVALGVDTPEEHREIREEGAAAATDEAMFRGGVNAPTQNRSYEGALEALASMKELIGEVEGADPRYERLRAEARAAGKGYFEYAVSKYNKPGLTELFSELAAQGGESADTDAIVNENIVGGDTANSEEKVLGGETELELADGILDVSAQDKAVEKDLEGEALERETLNPEILKPEE